DVDGPAQHRVQGGVLDQPAGREVVDERTQRHPDQCHDRHHDPDHGQRVQQGRKQQTRHLVERDRAGGEYGCHATSSSSFSAVEVSAVEVTLSATARPYRRNTSGTRGLNPPTIPTVAPPTVSPPIDCSGAPSPATGAPTSTDTRAIQSAGTSGVS